MKISTIISFCSNDTNFIDECINHVRPFSEEVSVCFGSKFFNGDSEDFDLIACHIRNNTDVLWSSFPVDKEVDPGYLHNRSRAYGYKMLSKPTDLLLFLDADEIVDTKRFIDWINAYNLSIYSSYLFTGYWYFRDVIYQSKSFEPTSVMVNSKFCSFDLLYNNLGERNVLLKENPSTNILGNDGLPMIHHYSWARTYYEMLTKVHSWGHRGNKDWVSLIEKEFKRNFDETCSDFVHHYTYKKVKPFINISNSL